MSKFPETFCSAPGCKSPVYDSTVTTCSTHLGKRNSDQKAFKHLQRTYAYKEIVENGLLETQKDLRPEIAVARILQASVLSGTNTQAELAAQAPTLADLLARTQNLILAQNKIEQDAGDSFSRAKLLELCQRLLDDIQSVLSETPNSHILIQQIAARFEKSIAFIEEQQDP